MQLTVDEIKKGILHPEMLVREHALRYFADSWSTDPTVMPLVVEAARTFKWAAAWAPHLNVRRLRQTPGTLEWFVDALERADQSQDAELLPHLWPIVARADIELLKTQQQRLQQLNESTYQKVIANRIRLGSLSPAECWREVEEFCEAAKHTHLVNNVDLGQATMLIEALGRDAGSAERVLSLLAIQFEPADGDSMTWMEPIAVAIAGELRLQPAIPLLIDKLQADRDDWTNEQCDEALAKIGGDETARAIARGWELSWHFRLYAASALEKIRTPDVTSLALDLFDIEISRSEENENGLILSNLLKTGLNNFSSEAIDPSRLVHLAQGELALREGAVAVATLAGWPLADLDQWKKQVYRERQERERHLREFLRAPYEPPRFALSKPPRRREPEPPAEDVEITKPIHAGEKVGRNDPCPCGSGKKYKKCCMGKE